MLLQELTDIVKELDRVLCLHYSEDEEVARRCCYQADGEPPMVRFFFEASGLWEWGWEGGLGVKDVQ